MFKLVGKEHFQVGHSKAKCTITIDAVSGFAYEYTLEVNGKSLNKFRENQSKVQKAWVLTIAGNPIRVCLGENMFLQFRRGVFLSAEVAFTCNNFNKQLLLSDVSSYKTVPYIYYCFMNRKRHTGCLGEWRQSGNICK